MSARARHVDISGRAARLGIDADHPARTATDAQAVAAIGGDVNAATIDREPLRVAAGVEARQPDAPHDRRRIGHRADRLGRSSVQYRRSTLARFPPRERRSVRHTPRSPAPSPRRQLASAAPITRSGGSGLATLQAQRHPKGPPSSLTSPKETSKHANHS